MSSTDDIEKPGDPHAQPENVTLQSLADASLNQSESPTAPERNDIAEAGDDRDSGGNGRKRKAISSCQICQAKLKDEKPYYQRYRICPTCSSIDRMDELDGVVKRFCQQCGKFQAISLFDGTMRTCRERLDRHAARRRKSHARLAAIRRGSPVDDYEAASPHAAYSPPRQHQQYIPQPLHNHHHNPYQQHQSSLSVAQPMLDLAHQILAQGRMDPQHQRAMQQQHQQQLHQQQMLEHLMATIAASRPAPSNLLNPVYHPTPLRFSPSPHQTHHPAVVNPTAAAGKLEAVLALLLSEAAAAAPRAPPPRLPPSPPPPQNDTETLQSMLQRLIAIANTSSLNGGGGGNGDGGGSTAPPAAPPPTISTVPENSKTNHNHTNAATATNAANTTSNEHNESPSAASLPPALAGLVPQLQAALAAMLKHQEEERAARQQ